jgi:hypothetical protein
MPLSWRNGGCHRRALPTSAKAPAACKTRHSSRDAVGPVGIDEPRNHHDATRMRTELPPLLHDPPVDTRVRPSRAGLCALQSRGRRGGRTSQAPSTSRPCTLPFFREIYRHNSHDRQLAIEAVETGYADMAAFGRPFIGNPDLVDRLRSNAPSNVVSPETYYGGRGRGLRGFQAICGLGAGVKSRYAWPPISDKSRRPQKTNGGTFGATIKDFNKIALRSV